MSNLSGRELDAAVARMIGWTNLAVSDWDHDAADPLDWGGIPPGETRVHWVPQYSTRIECAMDAYAALHERGWRINSTFHSRIECAVTLWHDSLGFARAVIAPNGREPGAVLAEAICRAIVEAANAE
jgi:hypothetical protein